MYMYYTYPILLLNVYTYIIYGRVCIYVFTHILRKRVGYVHVLRRRIGYVHVLYMYTPYPPSQCIYIHHICDVYEVCTYIEKEDRVCRTMYINMDVCICIEIYTIIIEIC